MFLPILLLDCIMLLSPCCNANREEPASVEIAQVLYLCILVGRRGVACKAVDCHEDIQVHCRRHLLWLAV